MLRITCYVGLLVWVTDQLVELLLERRVRITWGNGRLRVLPLLSIHPLLAHRRPRMAARPTFSQEVGAPGGLGTIDDLHEALAALGDCRRAAGQSEQRGCDVDIESEARFRTR